ncbi:MAG: TlpA family protein disulfide reductase [Deltaproteobacteria bacterium]|nr:TlpA family protein disulfide reductase [Deltaproteobacteria bacterium]
MAGVTRAGVVLLLAACCAAAAGRGVRAEDGAPAPDQAPDATPIAVGAQAPDFMLKTLNPEQSGMPVFSTKATIGSRAKVPAKALVLSFAASWCKPCRKELPELQRLEQTRLREHGIATALVLLDREPEPIEEMRAWLVDELGVTMPVLSDRLGIVGRRYGAHELPMLVVIAPGGVVRFVKVGYEDSGLNALVKALAEVAGLPPAEPEKGPRKHPHPK